MIKDESKDLVICPIPYDGSFMEVFYQAWNVIVHFLQADAKLPASKTLPSAASRQVARWLEGYRGRTIIDVVEALRPLGQPGLLEEHRSKIEVVETMPSAHGETQALLAPIARQVA